MRSFFFFRKSMLTASILMIFAVAPLSQALGQATMSPASSSSSSSSGETISGKTDDSWITTKVKSELASAKDVKSTDISVTTTEGVVALTGTVGSNRDKYHVIHIVKTVKGVKSVDASALTVVVTDRSASG